MPPVARKAREEARRARTDVYRQHVFEAAERVFAARGFEAAKVQEISKLAGLSMGTIYSIFPGKTEIFRAVLAIEAPLEIVVVAGRNEDVKRRLARLAPHERHRVKVLGFTDQIDELMAVADVVLSKPGGLTTSEVLARGAAMAVVNPIPGQESRNSDFLLENGAARRPIPCRPRCRARRGASCPRHGSPHRRGEPPR